MANRTIEAVLRVSAKLGPMDSLSVVQKKLTGVYKTVDAANQRQSAWLRATRSMYSEIMPMVARYAGPAAIAFGAYQMGKAASTMEDALFSIQKKTGATEEQLASLREEIKNTARDVPVAMSEIAAAFERGGAAGIPLDQLRDFAELTVKVSDAWDMAAEDVGNAFAGFEAGMGIARKDLESFADLINYLADSGIADERDIVSFIDRVGASLKNFGLAKEEIAAYGAAMLNLKIPAEVAARAMDTLTGKLIAPQNLSDKSRAALEAIVGDLGEYARLIEHDAGGALDLFWEKLSRFSNADRALYLGGLLGEGFEDEIMRLSAGVGELAKNLDMVGQKEKYLGSIAEAAERKMKLWSSQVQVLKNNFEGLGDSLGAPVLAKLNDGLTAINQLMDRQAEISTGRERLTAGGFSEATARLEWEKRYKAVNGDPGWSISASRRMNEAYRDDLAAFGRGEIRSLYGNLSRQEQAKRGADILRSSRGQYAELENMRLSTLDATRRMPVPARNPRAIPVAEQYASYSRASADVRRTAARRAFNAVEDMSLPAGQSAVGDMERRLSEALSQGGQEGGEKLGEAATQKMRESATSIGVEIGAEIGRAAAAAFNSNARAPSAAASRDLGIVSTP